MFIKQLVRYLFSISRAARLALPVLAVTLLAACDDPVQPDPVRPNPVQPGPVQPQPVRTPNFVRLQSDAGDYIGAGRTVEYTQATAILTVNTSVNRVSVRIQGDQDWNGEFALPANSQLQVGTYAGATRYPFNQPTTPGLSWFGDGRGCNQVRGSFTIDSLTFTNGALTALNLRFEQHCDSGAAALRGTIHWRAGDPTAPAGPVDPIPANLWRPDPAFVPASGTYLLLASDPGDYIGQGQFRVYAAPSTPVSVRSSGTQITINAGGYGGDFVAMLGTSPLKKGYYGELRRYPFHNPVRGGMSWSGNGRGCNSLTGWFAIDRIEYTGTTMTALEMRFEQHCEGMTPALRGAVRW
ncbi:MAG TPA: hypothetical protein VE913_13055, partial [Longimicrobium sp.]|nr:hypothetical protein [Longimicrobium sp.]